MSTLSNNEIERIAAESAKAAVRELLLAMGINSSDPESLIKMQLDFAHLREWREAVGAIKGRSLMVATGIIISGVMAAVWMFMRGH